MSRVSRIGVALALLIGASGAASAQTELMADKIRLGSAECVQQTGSGTPEGAVTGKVCDTYLRTNGTSFETVLYVKTTATTNTGWAVAGGGWTRSGTSVVLSNVGDFVGIGTATPDFKLQVDGAVAPETTYTSDIGSYLKKWLTIHAAELRVETLVATETMATIGGRINVAPTTQLTSDLPLGNTTIYVKHNNLANGDRVRLEANGSVEWMAITQAPQGVGPYSHTVTRNLDGSGANDWAAGDAVLNTGTTGDGYIDLYSDRSTRSAAHYGPTIVGNVRTGTTYSDLEERWAIGNLNGVYGYSGDIYGSAFGSPSASWLKIDPTNGLRLGNNTTAKVTIAPNGTATFVGDGSGVTAISGGNITTNTIAADRLTIGLGGNALGNSQFRLGLREPLGATGWAAGYGTDTKTWTTGVGYSGYTVLGAGTAWMNTVSTPENGTYRYLALTSVSCTPGLTYEFSAYLGKINLTSTSILLYFYTSAGGYLSSFTSATTTAAGGPSLADYGRVSVLAVAPASTAYCYLYASANTTTGVANPYLFITHAQFGERPTGTTVAAPWVAGGVTTIEGDQIATGAVSAAKITAGTITADRMAVAGGWTWADAYFKKDTGTEATSSGMAPTDWPFYAGAQYANRATAPFRVSPAGAVSATSGTIGGFTLGSTIFWTGSGATSVGLWGGVTGADDVRFWAGAADVDAAPFRVYESGKLIAGTGYFGDGSTDVAIDAQGIAVGSSGRISAGGGSVTINSDGIELQSGGGNTNRYKFSDGSYLQSNAGYSVFKGSTTTALAQSSTEVQVSSSAFASANGHDLGTSGSPWRDLYINRDVYLQNLPTTTAADLPVVWSSTIKALYQKTDGVTKNCAGGVSDFYSEAGIVTSATCAEPDTSPVALKAHIQTLDARIAQLEAQMALLLEEARKR